MSLQWEEVLSRAVSRVETPFYLCAWSPVLEALAELSILSTGLPVRHWLSFKTQPVRPLLSRWRNSGLGVEVVSEYELCAALHEGFSPDLIIVNGVAKHSWLTAHRIEGIRLHFDSLREVEVLAGQAREFHWRTGIRLHLDKERDPDEPEFGGQFGLNEREALTALSDLRKKGVLLESVHFHLRSNVPSADSYKEALEEVQGICDRAKFSPRYVDCGGGLPVRGIRLLDGDDTGQQFDLAALAHVLARAGTRMPGLQEFWLENGRFITARSAVLVVRVVDVKERPDSRYLICDGGRTNHALVSDWEAHSLMTVPVRTGTVRLTTVCGPTCMAFDRLIRAELPESIDVGDYIVWMDAGAYHIPWETRFSHGLATVIFCDENGELLISRDKETFPEWWSRWRLP